MDEISGHSGDVNQNLDCMNRMDNLYYMNDEKTLDYNGDSNTLDDVDDSREELLTNVFLVSGSIIIFGYFGSRDSKIFFGSSLGYSFC